MLRAQTVYAVGGYSIPSFASPDPIGSSTPNSGVFTTLSASGTFTASSNGYFSGALYGSANLSFDPPVANGKFILQCATSDGAMLYGRGSTNDVSIYNRDASCGFYLRPSDVAITSTAFSPTSDNATSFGTASFRFKDAFFSGQVKGGAGTGTGAPVMIGALSVNTTQVGNVGGGTDDLMTYSLPANSLSSNGKGVRVTGYGICANNVNNKTLTFCFGSQTIATSFNNSVASYWRFEACIFRTGASTQRLLYSVTNIASGAIQNQDIQTTTATQTDTGAITIKCTGAGTADNDIAQQFMFVEFIN